MERRETWPLMLAAGAVLLPLQWWPPMPLPGMQLADAVFALAFAAFLARGAGRPGLLLACAGAAFLFGVLASAAASGRWNAKLLGHAELVALAWMAASLPPAGARRLRAALVLAALGAALTAGIGLAFWLAGIETPLLYTQGVLLPGDYPRLRGTLVTAAMLASLAVAGLLLVWFERDLLARPLRRLTLGLGALALAFTYNRGLASGLIVATGMAAWRRGRGARLAWAALALLLLSLLALSIRWTVELNPAAPLETRLLWQEGNRWIYWRDAAAAIAANPLFGLGPGALPAAGWDAHNTWLNLWSVLGFAPLAAFALLLAAAIRDAARGRARGLLAALLFVALSSLHMDVEDMRHVWLLIGLGLAAGRPPS